MRGVTQVNAGVSRATGWLRGQVRRAGFDVTRFPPRSPSTLSGHTARVLAELGIECVLDVGANVGQYGDMLRAIGYTGLIVSFEPVDATFHELSRHAAEDANWRTIQMALGAEDGEATLNV